jgi:YD repeat-containing protein
MGETMNRRTEKIMLALMIAALAAVAAVASETITYSYDARGRLVQVKHSGTINNNVTANYQYDKADNRTNVNVASPNSPPQ